MKEKDDYFERLGQMKADLTKIVSGLSAEEIWQQILSQREELEQFKKTNPNYLESESDDLWEIINAMQMRDSALVIILSQRENPPIIDQSGGRTVGHSSGGWSH